MWAGESAILLCDGSNWFKVSGKTIPMACRMYRASSSQTGFTSGTIIKVQMTGGDGMAAMVDTGSYRALIKRTGMYEIAAAVLMDGSTYASDVTNSYLRVIQNTNGDGGTGTVMEASKFVKASVWSGPAQTSVLSLTLADNLTLWLAQNSGSSVKVYYGSAYTYLTVTEIPAW